MYNDNNIKSQNMRVNSIYMLYYYIKLKIKNKKMNRES